MKHYRRTSLLPFSVSTVFNWHKQKGAFERLTPPWQTIKILDEKGNRHDKGSWVKLKAQESWFKAIVEFELIDYQEGKLFKDKQIKGPLKLWEHTHLFEPQGDNQSEMIDAIDYALPTSTSIFDHYFEKSLNHLFDYRHQTLKEDLLRHQGVKPMKILISGSSGLVGSALVPFLTSGQHQVIKLIRSKNSVQSDEIFWDPEQGILDQEKLEGFDAVIHLAGESIMGNWTEEKKQKIRDSRVKSTQLLSHALSQLKHPPSVFVCGSAVGYYGNRGDEILTEQSSKGTGFLPDVCEEWEQATQAAIDAGIRTVNLRTGTVLSPQGGALKQLLTPFKWGVGGKLGSGQQYMSWIAMDDLIYAIYGIIQDSSMTGPVNAVSPHAVTNAEFTKILGKVLNRPTFFTVPNFVIQGVFGEMGKELLLSSQRVEPTQLKQAGFQFSYSCLEDAFRHLQ